MRLVLKIAACGRFTSNTLPFCSQTRRRDQARVYRLVKKKKLKSELILNRLPFGVFPRTPWKGRDGGSEDVNLRRVVFEMNT